MRTLYLSSNRTNVCFANIEKVMSATNFKQAIYLNYKPRKNESATKTANALMDMIAKLEHKARYYAFSDIKNDIFYWFEPVGNNFHGYFKGMGDKQCFGIFGDFATTAELEHFTLGMKYDNQ